MARGAVVRAFGAGRIFGAGRNPARAPLPRGFVRPDNYCLGGGSACSEGSTTEVEPRSSEDAAQSPAQSLVPLTVPTSLQPVGGAGVICFNGLPPTLGAAV